MDKGRSIPFFVTFNHIVTIYYAPKEFLALNKEYKTMTNSAVILAVPVIPFLVFNVTQLCTIPELTWVQVQSLPAFKNTFLFHTHLAREDTVKSEATTANMCKHHFKTPMKNYRVGQSQMQEDQIMHRLKIRMGGSTMMFSTPTKGPSSLL